MGVLLLVAVIIGALITFDVDGKIARATNDMVALIAGGGKDDGGGGNNPGGGGNNPGGGGSNPGGGGKSDDERRALLCLNSTAEVANCLVAARAPNAVSEKINERARQKLIDAQKKLYNTARPGTPEFDEALKQRNAALRELFDSRRITNNFIVKPLAQIRKLADPRFKDIEAGMGRLSKAVGRKPGLKPAPRPGNGASGAPVKATPASRFLSHLGKLGKGLGVAGTALGLYNNVDKDGAAKGIFETAFGTAAAYGTGAGITAICGAVGIATAGVGGLACAAAAFGGSYLAGKYGTEFAGWAWDRGADAVNAVNDHVIKPVADATSTAAKGVVKAGGKVLDGGKKVVSALNPFG
jgi:hypothetical protein